MKTGWCMVLIMIFLAGADITQADEDFKLYKKAKKETFNKKWDAAIENYRELMMKYPDSRYADDAHFWISYVFENKGELLKAFDEYQAMIVKSPSSVWVDDALIHQISIAEEFVKNGQNRYRKFLRSMLTHDIKNVRYQAAISLGKLRDDQAAPVLQEIADNGDQELSSLAESLIENLEESSNSGKSRRRSDMKIEIQEKKPEPETPQESRGIFGSLIPETRRMKIYEQLRKKGNTWTDLELTAYGLWHILPEAEFNDFIILQTDYDKREWLRKFWKKWDPTPTTDVNERKDEFLRRIYYAHSKYGQEWNYRQFNYLKKQYMRDGWSMAPWDSRGELYIKYGEPDFKDASRAFQKEIWTYHRFNVDFVVKPYVTNIYGNAIEAGPVSKRLYQNYESYIDAEYIYKSDFKFEPFNDIEPVKHFDLELFVENHQNNNRTMNATYEISGKEFHFRNTGGFFQAAIRQNYAVYDEDLNEVSHGTKDVQLTASSEKEAKEKLRRKINFTFEAPAGYYTFSIRLQDLNSRRLGIFMKEFQIE
ncbi:GWxTD domain-containing protein [candidate division KSB1 bacterium]|nr:GWxTD domain-containing protein [candidate division KSB1 bacterium]